MQPLLDPRNDRQVKTVKPPPHKRLDSSLIWDNESKPSFLTRFAELEIAQRPSQKRRSSSQRRLGQVDQNSHFCAQ